jgi:methylated-DNA-[protein]-cysteine S-methyltransferase
MRKQKFTEFEQNVWKFLKKIPRGKVTTYGDVAKALGRGRAVRAVGNAVGKNPFAPKIPCHRVVKSDGQLGGYSGKGGLQAKVELLKKEGVEVENGRIAEFQKKRWVYAKG